MRERRDTLLRDLAEGLKKLFNEKGEPVPAFHPINQGSYEMDTGIKPLDGDYDIDVGLIFHLAPIHDNNHPHEVKSWVYESLRRQNRTVRWRNPCVTVYYMKDGEPDHHVDLPVYTSSADGSGQRYLAFGKEHSEASLRHWEIADPEKLTEKVNACHSDDDDKQFKRVIRALKRWKQEQFPIGGNAAPPGIGLTLCAFDWFAPVSAVTDPLKGTVAYDDRMALEALVRSMLGQFLGDRLRVSLPVQPFKDVFKKMTDEHQRQFKAKLERLLETLVFAKNEASRKAACTRLQREFGTDFPVPEDEPTKEASPSKVWLGAGIVGSNQSA